MSVNDIRKKENMNPIPGGDSYLIPLNYAVVSGRQQLSVSAETPLAAAAAAIGPAESRAAAAALSRYQLAGMQQRLFLEKITEILRRERNDVMAQARRLQAKGNMGDLQTWIQQFYIEHKSWAATKMLPLMQVYAALVAERVGQELALGDQINDSVDNFVAAYAAEFGAREAAESETTLSQLVWQTAEKSSEEVVEELDGVFDHWLDDRAGSLATEETYRQGNATAVALYTNNGVEKLKSIATGDHTCPYCNALDQKVIGINEFFLQAGQSFQPGNVDKPLPVSHSKKHPPYHRGCDCIVVADVAEGLAL
jgi:hypothetical protein